MTYSVVSYADGDVLPSSSMTQVYSNIAAIAQADGGPAIVNSAWTERHMMGARLQIAEATIAVSGFNNTRLVTGDMILNPYAFFPSISQRRPSLPGGNDTDRPAVSAAYGVGSADSPRLQIINFFLGAGYMTSYEVHYYYVSSGL